MVKQSRALHRGQGGPGFESRQFFFGADRENIRKAVDHENVRKAVDREKCKKGSHLLLLLPLLPRKKEDDSTRIKG